MRFGISGLLVQAFNLGLANIRVRDKLIHSLERLQTRGQEREETTTTCNHRHLSYHSPEAISKFSSEWCSLTGYSVRIASSRFTFGQFPKRHLALFSNFYSLSWPSLSEATAIRLDQVSPPKPYF